MREDATCLRSGSIVAQFQPAAWADLSSTVCVGLGLVIQELILGGTVSLPGTALYLDGGMEWPLGLQSLEQMGAGRPKMIGARSERSSNRRRKSGLPGLLMLDLEAFRGQARGGVSLPPITAQSYEIAPDNSILSPTQLLGSEYLIHLVPPSSMPRTLEPYSYITRGPKQPYQGDIILASVTTIPKARPTSQPLWAPLGLGHPCHGPAIP